MIEAGMDFWRSLCPTCLLKQGHLEPVAQNHIQRALNVSKDGYSTISLGSLCQVLKHCQTCKIRKYYKQSYKCFLMFRRGLLCPLSLVLSYLYKVIRYMRYWSFWFMCSASLALSSDHNKSEIHPEVQC